MPTRSEPEAAIPSPVLEGKSIPPPTGLLAATVRCETAGAVSAIVVGALDSATLRRVRQDALTMRARHGKRITVEARFVDTPKARALLANLDDLVAHDIHVVLAAIAPRGGPVHVPPPVLPSPVTSEIELPAPTVAPPASPPVVETGASVEAAPVERSPDPFDLDLALRRAWLRPLRFLFDHYWRIEVSGLEHVPDDAPAIIAANHSGAVPADAFMLAVALELRQPSRCLRVLYDRFVDALPLVGPLYRRLGGVPASLANAELLLRRGGIIALFPEGIAGVEKLCTERYRLRPFKTGTARLSVRTGAPIVPVAIVGAEEAYPVVARLYRVGQLVGIPWIPLTPIFPLCGIAGALPLPSKWHIQFCPPIAAPVADGRSEEELVAETTAHLREALATGIADLLARRQGIFV
ncbi:MAG: acyltransferase family protein [Deltaproteobacteria bacterium]|nr:acyltransferase family protein [Deltaproteobacteria bacterium]